MRFVVVKIGSPVYTNLSGRVAAHHNAPGIVAWCKDTQQINPSGVINCVLEE